MINTNQLAPSFSNTLLNKILEFDVKLDSFEKLLDSIENIEIDSKIYDYMLKHQIQLSEKIAIKMGKISKFQKTLKLFAHPEKLPEEFLSIALNEADELGIYEKALRSNEINLPLFSTLKFWKHILSVVSLSEQPCSNQLMKRFTYYFEKYIKPEDINNIYDPLIFDEFPPDEKQIEFLLTFIKSMKHEYYSELVAYKHTKVRNSKLLEQKILPSPSLCKLFEFGSILNINNITPKNLYLCEFSFYREYSYFTYDIEIMQRNDEYDDLLIQFIKNDDDFSLINKFDDKTLSLIVCALFYTSNKNHIKLIGLTKENVLPFYAISFNYLKKSNKGTLKKSSTEMIDLFVGSCNYLENCDSSLFIESINAILINSKYFFDPCLFQIEISFQILGLLCDLFLNKKYSADELLIILVIFKLSCREKTQLIQDNILSITQKHGITLFNSIFERRDKIIKDERFNGCALNLNLFNTNELQNSILNEFNRSTSDENAFQLICFVTKFCTNAPELKIDDITLINQMEQKLINDERWDYYLILVQFKKKNNISVNFKILKEKEIPFNITEQLIKYPDYNNANAFIKYIINHPNLEFHLSLFEKLFELLMKEQSIAYKYISSSIEKIATIDEFTSDLMIKSKLILEKKPSIYYEYQSNLISVLKHTYAYSKNYKSFIRKFNVEPLKFPDVDFSFLETLINDQSLNSFICLHYLSSFFPFFFEPSIDESHYSLVVELVLPVLNCLSTIYDDQVTEEKTINLKKMVAALSFLFSCLNSTKFISEFIQWLFENIETLSDSQIICMSSILCSLYCTNRVNIIIFGYAVKYNLLDKIITLLSRDIHDVKFEQFYKRSVYNVILYHIKTIPTITLYENILFIEQIKDESITNPFEIMFNNFSIISEDIQPLQIIFPNENNYTQIINDFLKLINTKQTSWISYKNTQIMYNIDQIKDEFRNAFENEKYYFIYAELPHSPYKKTIKMLRYCNTQPKWIYQYIDTYKKFPIQREHYTILNQTITKLKEIEQNSKENPTDEDVEAPDKINPYDYLSDQIHHEKLFRKIIEELDSTKDNIQFLYSLINVYIKNTKEMITFLHIISESFSKMKANYPYLPVIHRLAQVICNCWQYNYDFDENFFKICGNEFIDISLCPVGRMVNVNLTNAAYILEKLNCEIPLRATHIIGFIFKFIPDKISYALDLFAIFGEQKVANIFPLIKKSYEMEIKSENPNYVNMKCYLEKVPSLAKKDVPFLYNFLEKCIIKYKNEECKNDDIRDLICQLFNFLAPEREQYQIIYSPKSTDIDFNQTLSDRKGKLKLETQSQSNTLLEQAPLSLLQSSSSKFWSKLYEKHRQLLSELLEKDESIFEKLTFLHDYHELVPFKIRSSYFRKYLKYLENERNRIKIEVSRSNILEDTFNSLVNKKPKELLGNLIISFIGEKGVDAGGLTCEWFTYIVKELFNPDFGLFMKTESNCYHPNSLSYINNNHIEYFKLAGEIIALALVKGQCVNAHLSMAFYRQILHQKIAIKDLEDFDESLFNSLQMVLDADDVKDLDLVFSIDDNQFGQITTIELIENGDKIGVTNDNRMEYVSLYANYKLRKSTIKQITAFCDSFDEIIPPKFIRIFTPSELDLMICGIPKIDVDDMKMYTKYKKPYHKDHPTIVMFFNLLSKWDHENLAKFLLFLTGSSQVPVNGFKYFMDQGKPIKISPGGEKTRLPVAHTCFKNLELPEYDNENDMNEKLLTAIQDCEFGLV